MTKQSRTYMNGYRILRYELKVFFYIIMTIFLASLWGAFFEDNLFRMDVCLYIGIAGLLIPFLYCCLRPISLMTVIKYLDHQLRLQQRLEAFIENLGKKDDVVDLQRKDTYRLISVLNPRSAVKFKWPLETRILPFVVFLLCLLFAGKDLFHSERRFVTGTDSVKEKEIKYQIIKSPFENNSANSSNKIHSSQMRKNINNTNNLYKVNTGNLNSLTKLKMPGDNHKLSISNAPGYKSMALPNQQRGEEAKKHSKSNKARGNTSPHKDAKLLTNPDDKTDNSIPGKKETGERPTKSKLNGSVFTETDVSGTENILNEGVAGEASSRVNDDASTAMGNGAGAGSYSVKQDVVELFSPTQHSFIGDLSHIDEMISKNNIQPSLREYVKKYFLSLHVKSDVGE